MAHILVIDDEKSIRTVCSQFLQREGYEVSTLPCGKGALDVCRDNDVKLVITDIIMPEKEGLETIQELRHAFSNMPIIAISGGGSMDGDQCLMMARHLGANMILRKPVSREELCKAVSSLLNDD